MKRHTLYRMYDAGNVLLYIGLTNNPSSRLWDHSASKRWWMRVETIKIEHFLTREELKVAEKAAIRQEKPLHNVQNNAGPHRRTFNFEFCECDGCGIPGECEECDECSGRTGEFVLVEYREATP